MQQKNMLFSPTLLANAMIHSPPRHMLCSGSTYHQPAGRGAMLLPDELQRVALLSVLKRALRSARIHAHELRPAESNIQQVGCCLIIPLTLDVHTQTLHDI